ncbi:hypothetical protein D3C84_1035230 [compost metagenome]
MKEALEALLLAASSAEIGTATSAAPSVTGTSNVTLGSFALLERAALKAAVTLSAVSV